MNCPVHSYVQSLWHCVSQVKLNFLMYHIKLCAYFVLILCLFCNILCLFCLLCLSCYIVCLFCSINFGIIKAIFKAKAASNSQEWSLSSIYLPGSVVAERSSPLNSSSGVVRMWVWIPAWPVAALVSLSKTLNHNCFVLRMGCKAVGHVCCVMHVKKTRTLFVKEKGLAPVFLDLRLEHPAGWICARYKTWVQCTRPLGHDTPLIVTKN